MVDMIDSMRAYEAGQKVIQTIDETLGKAASAGRLGHRRNSRPVAPARVEMPTTRRACSKDSDTAAAGMAAQQQKLDAVANDLANANTTGYKHGRVGFRDLLYDAGRPPVGQRRAHRHRRRAPSTPAAASSRARCSSTGDPLDVAIEGEGFLKVHLPDGRQALTRDGEPARRRPRPPRRPTPAAIVQPHDHDPQGRRRGRRSRSARTAPSAPPAAASASSTLVTVRSPQQPARPSATTPSWPPPPPARPAPRRAATLLTQGALEASNTDIAEAMVDMIDAQRTYQLPSKAIQTADQMMEIANGVEAMTTSPACRRSPRPRCPPPCATAPPATSRPTQAALGFEQVMLGQLVKAMVPEDTGPLAEGPYAAPMQDTLAQRHRRRRRPRPRRASSTRRCRTAS